LNSALSGAEIWHLKEGAIKVKYHCSSVRMNESSQFHCWCVAKIRLSLTLRGKCDHIKQAQTTLTTFTLIFRCGS